MKTFTNPTKVVTGICIRAAWKPAVHYQKGKVTTYDNGTCKHPD